ANSIIAFSDFAIGIANGVLPIHSIKLSVTKTNNTNNLSWNIIATDGDKIVIEKSTNATDFNTLHASTFFATGTYNDGVTTNKIYYRLKVSDKNGAIYYSNIVVIDDRINNGVKVYPTITKSFFTLQNNLQSTGTIKLFSLEGKLILEQQIVPGTNIISIANLASQIYFYQVENLNTKTVSGKIIKQ
ncbi:MAG: T9SS type A sorting domain-containing protein, partial [Chitinophagaceae bacterium]|nr:T9SS type A sorting domain-containing protein [Chitinophagaceae bacterium]